MNRYFSENNLSWYIKSQQQKKSICTSALVTRYLNVQRCYGEKLFFFSASNALNHWNLCNASFAPHRTVSFTFHYGIICHAKGWLVVVGGSSGGVDPLSLGDHKQLGINSNFRSHNLTPLREWESERERAEHRSNLLLQNDERARERENV